MDYTAEVKDIDKDLNGDLKKPLNADPDEQENIPEAPDGGYGWVVVCASFMMGLVVDGCLYTFGIMTMEFAEYFQTTKMKIAFAGAVMNGICLSAGPLVTGLCSRYSCRTVAISGSLLGCAGFIASTFSPSVATLVATYGVVAGCGLGMMHLPSIIIVAFYFTRKRATATGIAMCGSGIGAFIFAPIIQQLLLLYDWRGAQLLLAGVLLHGCVMGLLFRPPKIHETSVIHEDVKLELSPPSKETPNRLRTFSERSDASAFTSVLRKDIFYSGSLLSIHDHSSHHNHKISKTSLHIVSGNSIYSTSNYKSALEIRRMEEQEGISRDWCSGLLSFIDFSLMRDLAFDMYSLSCFLAMFGFWVPFMFLPELAIKEGIAREAAAFLLSIMGIANTVGRVLCGLVTDRPWADCLVVNVTALTLGGAVLMLIPLFRSHYVLLCLAAAVYGLCIAVFASLRSIIMVELMSLDKLTNAFGLVTMFHGLSTFIGNPIAGAIFDHTANYDILFYYGGTMMVLGALACAPCRRLAARAKNTTWT